MSDLFQGYVLRGSRSASSNAPTTGESTVGVLRSVQALPKVYSSLTGQPPFTDFRADAYRSTIQSPFHSGAEEYLVWAANTAPLAVLANSSWAITNGTGAIPTGTFGAVDSHHTSPREDGSGNVIVTDNGNRSLGGILSITVVRGDDATQTKHVLTVSGGDIQCLDPDSHVVQLLPSSNTLAVTNPTDPTKPCLSLLRGDKVVGVSYWLASATFWWTRNDQYQIRFGWDGGLNRWAPFSGGPVQNIGQLLVTTSSFTLTPKPRISIGSYLPGGTTGDSYTMLRVGSLPGSSSTSLGDNPSGPYRGVLVVSDDDATPSYSFSGSPPAVGVIGATNGVLILNPAFVASNLGQFLWYSPADYTSTSNGIVGTMVDALTTPMYIAPVPGPTDRPILRFGNRRPLVVSVFDTEALLSSFSPSQGQVGVAVSTGLLKFNTLDLQQANPGTVASPNALFNPLYLDEVIRYDGVSLNLYPQPLRAPVQLVDSTGTNVASYTGQNVYLPQGVDLPGLGVSGVINTLDRTGAQPDLTQPITSRPGASGLVKALPSTGDLVFFSSLGTTESVSTVNFSDEVGTLAGGTAAVVLAPSTHGSQVFFSSYDQENTFQGVAVYAQVSEFCPALYPTTPRILSRVRDVFAFTGSEAFTFVVDHVEYTWLASSLSPTPGPGVTYTASAVSTSIASILSGTAQCVPVAGRVAIGSTLTTGIVEIGFGNGGTRNIQGCQALGFIPGAYVSSPGTGTRLASDPNWLVDSGVSFGIPRSPMNLDRQQGIPDVCATQRVTDTTLSSSVPPNMFSFLQNTPLLDVAGYDNGVFFSLSSPTSPGSTLLRRLLHPLVDVQYLFSQGKFAWLFGGTNSTLVTSAVTSLDLGQNGVVPESMTPGVKGYLQVAAGGGPFTDLQYNTDFILPSNGIPGTVNLIQQFGSSYLSGYHGTFTSGLSLFTDTTASFGVSAYDRLKILTPSGMGYYEAQTPINPTNFPVTPIFEASSTAAQWEVHRGYSPNGFDPTLLADVTLSPFTYLVGEPFQVRIYSLLGVVGGSISPANVSKAMRSRRTLWIRYGLVQARIPVTVLTVQSLGPMANGTLIVPATTHRTNGSFGIRVGTQLFSSGSSNLTGVTSFSPDPDSGNGIEYLTTGTPGLLKFGSHVLANNAGAYVSYVELLDTSSAIPSGMAELDPATGTVALSSVDIAANPGVNVYLAEDLVAGVDVTLNPINGAFVLTDPARTGQLVEAQYTQALADTGAQATDSNGNPIQVTEFLPVIIHQEIATLLANQTYDFNPLGRTIVTTSTPVVYAGNNLLTYGAVPGVVFDFPHNSMTLLTPVAAGTQVLISYAVMEATGGETAYTASTPPVWRPPFNLPAGSSSFTLPGNRTEFQPGMVLVLGDVLTYVQSNTYSSSTNTTLVDIYPPLSVPAGSLTSGGTTTTQVSDRPVTPSIDGISILGVATGILPYMADAYGLSSDPLYDTVSVGSSEIRFQGDVRTYLQTDHLLELRGYPFLITAPSTLSTDGRYTSVSFHPPAPISFSSGVGRIRVSYRPFYAVGTTTFTGLGPVIPSEPYDLILWGQTDPSGNPLPGQVLIENVDYTLDATSGSVTFKSPARTGFGPNQRLTLHHTRMGVLQPVVSNGVTLYPRVQASFLYQDAPSATNGILGGVLLGTYTYDSPDTFYAQSVPVQDYLTSYQSLIQSASNLSNPSFGGPVAPPATGDNGTQGPLSQQQDLYNQDRAARTYLVWYNATISAFEQILETISGQPIGDRDGKFRTYVGYGSLWAPPGYEDDILGFLNPRVVWFDVFNAATGGTPFRVTSSDPLVDPLTASTDSNGRLIGPSPDTSSLGILYGFQKSLVTNDVDDLVIIGETTPSRSLVTTTTVQVQSKPDYQRMSLPHRFSRIFPEASTAFTTLSPGVGVNPSTGNYGVYTAGRTFTTPAYAFLSSGQTRLSTTNKPIGRLCNPVLGNITNVLGMDLVDRLARAHLWGYSSTGYASLDAHTSGVPTLVATPLDLVDFPLVPTTGLPDPTKLVSAGSITNLPDLTTGDLSLHTPPFQIGAQLALGYPDGTSVELGSSATLQIVNGTPRYSGVFVHGIYQGCLLTLSDSTGAITDPSVLTAGTSLTSSPVSFQKGMTLYAIPSTGSAYTVSNPMIQTDIQTLASHVPGYRTGFDVGLTPSTGEILDVTLPSFADPTFFGLKELLGQKPPQPMSTVEAKVAFRNGSITPANLPALQGQVLNDSGDRSIPYVYGSTTEIDQLQGLNKAIEDISSTDSPSPPPGGYVVQAVYPDEILGLDGAVVSTGTTPAALTTAQNLSPGAAVYPTPGHAGVGSLAQWDLLFIQPGSITPHGSSGILSIGAVEPGVMEPPRFISPMSAGWELSYTVTNAISWISYPAFGSGIVVTQDTNTPGTVFTTFDVSSLGTSFLVLDDGMGGGSLPTPVGGLNDFFTNALVGCTVIVKVIVRTTGQFQSTANVWIQKTTNGATILTTGFQVSGDSGSTWVPLTASLSFQHGSFVVTTASTFFQFPFFDPTTPGPGITQTQGFHDFGIDVNATNGSLTASIGSDRLTFSDKIDFRTAKPRSTTYPIVGGSDLTCTLTTLSAQTELWDTVASSFQLVNLSINNVSTLNAGDGFTFLPRVISSASPYGVGQFSSGIGSLKVMGFEGRGNIPIALSNVTFSAVPSSRQNTAGPILAGTAVMDELFGSSLTAVPRSNRLIDVASTAGSLTNVLPGDELVVFGGMAGSPSTKAGTYIVRDARPATISTYDGIQTSSFLGSGSGWCPVQFPTVVSVGSGTLTVSAIQTTTSARDSTLTSVPSQPIFQSSGRVFVVLSLANLTSSSSTTYAGSVYSAAYTGLSGSTFTGLSDYRDGVGSSLTAAQFQSAVLPGMTVSGMGLLPVQFTSTYVPGHNVPGTTILGFTDLQISRTMPSGSLTKSYSVAGSTILGVAGGASTVSVYEGVPFDPTTFNAAGVPYAGTPVVLDIREVNTDFDVIHDPHSFIGAGVGGTRCLLPGDALTPVTSLSTPGYQLEAGIFLEPTFPTPVQDLNSGSVNVVDAGHSLSTVGTRSLGSFYLSASPPATHSYQEQVTFEVHRIRRFQPVGQEFLTGIQNLRYVYETRRGIVGGTSKSGTFWEITAQAVNSNPIPSPLVGGSATQLGNFNNPLVNIHAGDTFRLLDSSGNLLAQSLITAITGSSTLILASPGLDGVTGSLTGLRFEIWVSQIPVPHEQSYDQLLDISTTTLLSRIASPSTGAGGSVGTTNVLTDIGENFESLGVAEGDLLVIDPAGTLSGPSGEAVIPERGFRPQGDTSILGNAAYGAGGPSRLDDNRGYYTVSGVGTTTLSVSAEGQMAGDSVSGDKILDSSYVIYPTIHASSLTSGTEGQMDLRLTSVAGVGTSDPNSYLGTWDSIAPFSYRILRPTNLLSPQAMEQIVSGRERVLSWMDALYESIVYPKGSTYFLFQANQEVSGLGTSLDPGSTLGLLRQTYLTQLLGVVGTAPYVNSNTCVSILDRRFWILDLSLDYTWPPYVVSGPFYTTFASGGGRPVLPDRISDVLDQRDRLRQTRFAWLSLRTHRQLGTLEAIDRSVTALANASASNNQFLRVLRTMSKS